MRRVSKGVTGTYRNCTYYHHKYYDERKSLAALYWPVSQSVLQPPVSQPVLQPSTKKREAQRRRCIEGRILIVAVSIVLLALIQIGGWAQTKYVPKENEEIYGTWLNEKRTNTDNCQKVVITADGWKEYYNISDSVSFFEGREFFDSKWTDSEGNIWYKTFGTVTKETAAAQGVKYQELDKISSAGTVWESVYAVVVEYDPDSYPTKVDPTDCTYKIYYRTKK